MNSELKVCVIGATGFIGNAITEELSKRKIKWKGISRRNNSNPLIEQATTKDELVKIFNSYPYIINASGSLKPNDFEKNSSSSLKVLLTSVNLICEAIEGANLQKVIHISSAGTIYGEGEDNKALNEESSLEPISFYGKAKMQEEKAYEDCANKSNCEYVSARVSNPFGNKEKTTHGLIDVLINSIKENEQFYYYKYIDPSRDFVYVNDMAEMIVNLTCNDSSGIFNICSGKSYKMSEIIEFAKKYSQSEKLLACRDANSYDVIKNNLSAVKIKQSGLYVNTIDIFEYIREKLEKN